MADKVASAIEAAPLWEKSIADPFTSPQGLTYAQAALDDAAAVLMNVKLRFSGTVPPAPWPATPEIEKAVREMTITRDYFDTLAPKDAEGKVLWPKSGKVGATLVAKGRALYGALADLESRAEKSTTLDDLVKLIPRPTAILQGLPALLLLLGGLWALEKAREVKRALAG